MIVYGSAVRYFVPVSLPYFHMTSTACDPTRRIPPASVRCQSRERGPDRRGTTLRAAAGPSGGNVTKTNR